MEKIYCNFITYMLRMYNKLIAMKDRSNFANPFLRELAVGASQYTFAGELQSGAFLLDKTNLLQKNGGDIVINPKWLFSSNKGGTAC